MSDWSQLPDDILLLIFEKLRNLADFIKFRSICKTWRSATHKYRKRLLGLSAGIFISNYARDRGPQHRFLPVTHVNRYADDPCLHERLPLLSLPQDPAAIFAPMWKHDTLIIGSNEGWLVVVEPPSSMYLTNPVTGAKVWLPSIKSIPGWSEGPFNDERRFFGSIKPWKAVLSGSPNTCTEASPCYVMILYRNWRKVPFCKIGDKSWNCVEIPHSDDNDKEVVTEDIWLNDAVYCKGLFYIVRDKVEKLYAFDPCCSSPTLSERVRFLPQEPPEPYDWQYGVREYHLAELEGQLLLIYRDLSRDILAMIYEDISRIFTFRFEVYKLDMQNNNWVAAKSLGEYALFVGRHQSFYLSELDVAGVKANSIYYLSTWGRAELEILYLEDSRTESFDFDDLNRRSFWFTPVPWDPKEKDAEHRVTPRKAAVVQTHERISISNKFNALIDDDSDPSNDDGHDDDLVSSAIVAKMESKSYSYEEINDLSLSGPVLVDRRGGDSSLDVELAYTIVENWFQYDNEAIQLPF